MLKRFYNGFITDKWSDLLAGITLSAGVRESFGALKTCSERYRFIWWVNFSVWTAIIFVTAVVLLVWLFLSWPPEKGRNAGQYEHIYTHQEIDNPGQWIGGKETANYTNTPDKTADKKPSRQESLNSYNKDKRDVNAQEGMWRAAIALVVLTVFQIFIGAATVIFVIFTFNTQRRELGAANRTAEAAENAERARIIADVVFDYVDGDGKSLVVGDVIEEHGFLRPNISFRNHGRTPAFDVEIQVIYQPLRAYQASMVPDRTIYAACNLISMPPNKKIRPEITGMELAKDLLQTPRGSPDNLDYIVWTKISYRTIFDDPTSDLRVDITEYVCGIRLTYVETKKGTHTGFAKGVFVNGRVAEASEWPNA